MSWSAIAFGGFVALLVLVGVLAVVFVVAGLCCPRDDDDPPRSTFME